MGCTSSQLRVSQSPHPHLLLTPLPSIWFVGGGPGSKKGKICQYIIKNYKFKYLSIYDLVLLQCQKQTLDSQLIYKLNKQKKIIPAQLLVKLLKNAIVSFGIKGNFIIDGFPNSYQDIIQFYKSFNTQEIYFYGYFYIKVSKQTMVQSGIKTLNIDQNKNKQKAQQQVKQIVDNYIQGSEFQKIKKYLSTRNKYYQIDGQKGVEKAYQQIKQYLASINIKQPTKPKILFSSLDDQTQQLHLMKKIINRYGFYHYSLTNLINQSKLTQSVLKLQKQKKFKQLSQTLFSLIIKKIQKHSFQGNFLISHLSKSIDFNQLYKIGNLQTTIIGCLFIQQPEDKQSKQKQHQILATNKKANKISNQYQKQQNSIKNIFEQKGLLIRIKDQKLTSDIDKILKQNAITPRIKTNLFKIIFTSTINSGMEHVVEPASKTKALYIDMDILLLSKIKENSLYSQSIQLFKQKGQPIQGQLAVKLLIQKINISPKSSLIFIKGFPNSSQQLSAWQSLIGNTIQLSLILYSPFDQQQTTKYLKQQQKNRKITHNIQELIHQNYNDLEQKIKKQKIPYYCLLPEDNTDKIMEIFKNFHFT